MSDKQLRITFQDKARSEFVISFYGPSLTAEAAAGMLHRAEFDLAIIENRETITEVPW